MQNVIEHRNVVGGVSNSEALGALGAIVPDVNTVRARDPEDTTKVPATQGLLGRSPQKVKNLPASR